MTASRPRSAPKHVQWKEEEIVYSFEYETPEEEDVDTSETSDDSDDDKIPGQIMFNAMTNNVLVIYDITMEKLFIHITSWYQVLYDFYAQSLYNR